MDRAEMVSRVLSEATTANPEELARAVAKALGGFGVANLVIYVVDYEQQSLWSIEDERGGATPRSPPVAIMGTMAGRAFQTQQVVTAGPGSTLRIWAPIRERSERLGVVELELEGTDLEGIKQDAVLLASSLGQLLGHLVRTADRYTDRIERERRRRQMSLAAEMQWDLLLPSMSFEAPGISLAGYLEPAYEVGGDGFDYSINDGVLHFSIFDAMGHGLRSGLMSSLVLASFRYSRRRGRSLSETALDADRLLVAEFGEEAFVTGHLATLDLGTGRLAWVNAGHPDPLVVRQGKIVAEPHVRPCLPLGVGVGEIEVGEYQLEPEDCLLFYSDGVIEAHPSGGEQFSLERLKDRVERHIGDGLVSAELLRRVIADVVEHRAELLQDDATLIVLEWSPPR